MKKKQQRQMKHRHHIIPRHAGGTDDPENIVTLTIEQHAQAHRALYEQHGDHFDYIAWKTLSGLMEKEEIVLEILRRHGKVQGRKNAETGHMRRIQKLSDTKIAGRKGGHATMATGKGAFADPVERRQAAKLGGKIQGQTNAKTGHLKRIAQLPNNRNKGMLWVTNGIDNKMINSLSTIEQGWYRGRTKKTKI